MLSATLHEWKRKIEQLQQRWRGARQENERLRKENEVLRRREKQWESEREQWERERKRLERERERLRGEIDNLKRQLEEAQRANKRQAAPFSRGTRKEHPKTPDRKSTRLNSSHSQISYAVFCLKKKKQPTFTKFYNLILYTYSHICQHTLQHTSVNIYHIYNANTTDKNTDQ